VYAITADESVKIRTGHIKPCQPKTYVPRPPTTADVLLLSMLPLAKNSRWGKTNKKKKEHLCDEITVIMSH
jgi:hypothetical protein